MNVIKTRYGKPVYDSNPFLVDLDLDGVMITKEFTNVTEQELTDKNGEVIFTGVNTEYNSFTSLKYVQVTDVYIGKMISWLINGSVVALTNMFFLYEINHKAVNKDYVFIPYERIVEIAKELSVSVPTRSTISKGLTKLYKDDCIANHPYGNSWYWFNPSMMFNGNIRKILLRGIKE